MISLWQVFLIFFLLTSIRYIVFAGVYYLSVAHWFKPVAMKFKIDPEDCKPEMMKEEFKYGMWTNVMFGVVLTFCYWMYTKGWTKIYLNMDQYGIWYIPVSVFLLLFFHDTYFYWAHYCLHKVKIFRKLNHSVHHRFHNPSAWSAFSVHPAESTFELLYRPLIILLLPVHPIAIIGFALISFALNVFGHAGYEFLPRGFIKNPLFKFAGNPTHHIIHHKKAHYNFSLYFSHWDKIMGTEAPEYEETFEYNTRNNPLRLG
jgi:lathosterol oxidase